MTVCKVILIGHLGADPESKTFADGGSISNISVAHTKKWNDRTTGEKQEKTEWCRVVLRDRGSYKLGHLAATYLKKGSKVYIEGELATRAYDKDGQKHYITEIIANEMQMLDGKQDNGAQGGYQAPQAQQQSAPAPQPKPFDDDLSDIPF